MIQPAIALLPVPRKAYYLYGGDKREDYLVLGFVLTQPGREDPNALYHSTKLLVIRSDGQATYLGIGNLIFEETDQ